MSDAEPFDPSKFWQFSLGHYARAGVESACLSLQNRYRGNVNLALLLHWLDCQHLPLTEKDIQHLVRSTERSEHLLGQYRTLRQALRPQLDCGGYQQLLQFELELEKQQQRDLIACLNDHCHPARTIVSTPDLGTADNLWRYCRQLGAIALLPALQAKK